MTQIAGVILLKVLKYFEVILKIFEFSYVKEIIEILKKPIKPFYLY